MGKLAEIEQILIRTDSTLKALNKRLKERGKRGKIPLHMTERALSLTKTIKIEAFDEIHKILIEDE